MSQQATLYISKRCPHCKQLLVILSKRDDIRGMLRIVAIDEEPYPSSIKAVP